MKMDNCTRRDFLSSTLLGAIAASAPLGFAQGKPPSDKKPNVIILFIDDLGYGDLACFGNKQTPTPHIDSLADDGVKCTMSYITNAPCSPSRCSLMTGMYAQRFGKSGMARGLPIPDDHPTMAEFMLNCGYETGMIGKWDIGSSEQGPHQRGFTQVAREAPGERYRCTKRDGTEIYRPVLDGDHMLEFVERNKDKPFFLYFSPHAIHSSLKNTPKRYRERIKKEYKGKRYKGAVVAVDDQVGRLLKVLEKHNLKKNTLIFLTGDNGPNLKTGGGGSAAPYRGGKGAGTQWEGWVHTPTIVSWPNSIPAGKSYEGLMCTLDFYATIAAATGRALPERCDGTNLLPYLKGEKRGDAHEYLFWHNADPTDAKRRNLYAVRWKDWRLVKRGKRWRLYDIRKDPRETNDVIGANPEVAANMRKHYDDFVATLPPLKPSADYKKKDGGKVETGWGWIMGDGTHSGK